MQRAEDERVPSNTELLRELVAKQEHYDHRLRVIIGLLIVIVVLLFVSKIVGKEAL